MLETSNSRRDLWTVRANRLLRFGAPVALALLFWWYQGRYGFNPTDDGFVLAQSWRLLHGEIPHLDFTSPRPLGSAILHLPELLLPWGTLAFSRLVVAFQLIWIAIATVEMFPSLLRRSALERFALVTIAFLVNVGTWPLMAWHTIDGLFVGVTALWLAVRPVSLGRWRHVQWGALWLLAGFAPLVKQGFMIVPMLVVLLLVVHRRWRGFYLAPLALIPGLFYLVLTLGTPGGLLNQLYSGSGKELLNPLRILVGTVTSVNGLLVMICAVAAVFLLRFGNGPRIANVAIALGLVAAPILFTAHTELFGLGPSWPYLAVVCVLVLTVLLIRTLERLAMIVVVLGLGYAISLSWGVPAPSLLAGTLLVISLIVVMDEHREQSEQLGDSRIRVAIVVILAVVVAGLVLQSRSEKTYAEPPRADLTATVNDPSFALIMMSDQSSAYIESLQMCLSQYPAGNIAVLPDGAGLYPLLKIRNPFELDWWLLAEESGDHSNRVDARIDELNSEGDWLVLFQSYGLNALPNLPITDVNQASAPFAYSTEDSGILADLNGVEVECGSLTGKYSAPQS